VVVIHVPSPIPGSGSSGCSSRSRYAGAYSMRCIFPKGFRHGDRSFSRLLFCPLWQPAYLAECIRRHHHSLYPLVTGPPFVETFRVHETAWSPCAYAQVILLCYHTPSSCTANLQHRTLAQQLSAPSLKRSNLLRQQTKERLIARCPLNQLTIPSKKEAAVPPYDSPLLAPQAPLFTPPGASCTLYVAYPACASRARKALTSAALKPVSAFAGVAELEVTLSGAGGRPLLGSRLWLARCAQKVPGGWEGWF
jgi:hypothetical protein